MRNNQAHTYLRYTTGVIIALHGLLRIVFMRKYISFVLDNFQEVIPSETALTIGAALFPFVEFFTGLLIVWNLKVKKALVSGFLISLVMGLFLIAGDLYPRLIYHIVVVGFIGALYFSPHARGYTRRSLGLGNHSKR